VKLTEAQVKALQYAKRTFKDGRVPPHVFRDTRSLAKLLDAGIIEPFIGYGAPMYKFTEAGTAALESPKCQEPKFLFSTQVRVPIYKIFPVENGVGFMRREIGEGVAECQVFIDLAVLEQVAQRAATNLTRRAKQGPIIVKASVIEESKI
jgi:hypothetical protein